MVREKLFLEERKNQWTRHLLKMQETMIFKYANGLCTVALGQGGGTIDSLFVAIPLAGFDQNGFRDTMPVAKYYQDLPQHEGEPMIVVRTNLNKDISEKREKGTKESGVWRAKCSRGAARTGVGCIGTE